MTPAWTSTTSTGAKTGSGPPTVPTTSGSPPSNAPTTRRTCSGSTRTSSQPVRGRHPLSAESTDSAFCSSEDLTPALTERGYDDGEAPAGAGARSEEVVPGKCQGRYPTSSGGSH